ncbi:MAG: hypothetical protein HQM08_10205 [Candidatus Riflebacteria bacterium]|nr:hypothetical protein [Candidatus Riflebacteria bacterium]
MKIGFLIPNKFVSHNFVCLMQGFHALGWEICTNWNFPDGLISRGISAPFESVSSDYLQKVDSNELTDDLLLVDVSDGFGDYFDKLCKLAETRPVVLTNMEDPANFRDYPECFIVFSAHFNRLATREGRLYPLGFNLSEDLILLSNAQDLSRKRNVIVRNFNDTFSQSVRNSLDLVFVKSLEKFFEMDRRRTSPSEYLSQLSRSAAICSYGGDFMPNFWENEQLRKNWEQEGQRTYKFKYLGAEPVVLRWDSWRFFESAIMACAPIQLDFGKYGFAYPTNPEPWVHYIPVDLSSVSSLPQHLSDRVKDDPEFMFKIGRNARQWVIENFSPRKQAEYVLSVVSSIWPKL